MAGKYLYSWTDDNPDLQNQIGCMTGIFQLFDRQQILTGRRIGGHSPKRLPYGSSHFNNGSFEMESNSIHHRLTAEVAEEKNSTKLVKEKQRVSMESSRASFSSYSRSSFFSSPDCNRTAQPEALSFDRTILPETPSRAPAMSQSSPSPQFWRQSLDLRDGVKDSMFREAQQASVKTSTKVEPAECAVKHINSPRHLQPSKSINGSSSDGINGKQTLPADLKESLRVLAKIREATWCSNEAGELSRSSCDSKDGSFVSVQKDAPRFSYDGSDLSRLSFESRDTFNSTFKSKELPRLSLDSRVGSIQRLNSDPKSKLLKNSRRDAGNSSDRVPRLQPTSGAQKRPPSVVAKLMGLDTLPEVVLASDNQLRFVKTCPVEDFDPFSRSSKSSDTCRPIQKSNSLENSWKEPASSCKKPDSVMKPIPRFPIEPAPWKQIDGTRGSQKPALKHLKAQGIVTNSSPSIYVEIEKRLKDLELSQPGKDLRALKHIIEAMRAKGLVETTREEQHDQGYTSPQHRSRLVNEQKPHSDRVISSKNKGGNSLKTFESPIVIMKPAKLVEKSGILSPSVIPKDRLLGLPKRRGEYADSTRSTFTSRASKEQIPKPGCRKSSVSSTDYHKNNCRNLKTTQTSRRSQELLPKEHTISSVKCLGSMSPLQQKRLELDKRSRPPVTPESSRSRRQPNKQQPELGSPGSKRRPKSANLQQIDNQSSEISSETRDGNFVWESGIDMEVTNAECCAEGKVSQSQSMKASKYSVSRLTNEKLAPRLREDGALAELALVASEHPSPVSVLDNTMYKDDTLSPVKQMPHLLKDDQTMTSDDISSREQRDSTENLSAYSIGSCHKSEINRRKLENIEHLMQKLRRLNSNHDEAQTDYIASLCETTNPNHRYISEILLASGFLLRDFISSLKAFRLDSSGRLINPELFLVLEQTKSSTPQKEGCSMEKLLHTEKFHRKLIFDAVNEILAWKLASVGDSPEPWFRPDKLERKSLNAQNLLRELCSEIDQLLANKSGCGLDDEENSLKRILWENVMHHRTPNWTDFHGEISGMVLDVEQMIFKDLVNEVVHGNAAGFRIKSGRRCRQLFA